jgi:hypothetical protein
MFGQRSSSSKERWRRGMLAAADSWRGSTTEYRNGPLVRRSRFYTEKVTCQGREKHLTLHEKTRLQLWAARG